MAEDGKIKIDKFDGHDFGFWKMQIEDYLYQKKLHEPLAEAKPTCMKAEDWTLLDREALGAVRLSLAKNVAYNVVNEKTTYGLLKALSNMYEKPSASNKVFLIRQLVNTKMNEGASVADHVNEFNSILSRLMSVDIKFDDEVQALLLLSSLPESWSGTVTAVSGSTGSTKLKFDNIRDLILGEDIRRKTSGEYSNSLLSAEDKGIPYRARLTVKQWQQKKMIEDYLYQKKLHEPLAEAKPTSMKAEDWVLLDRQALGAVRLSLAKNVAYNVVNEKTTYGLLKALSNMYEKPIHVVTEFNSILSRLMSVDIKFDDEVQALLLLSSLPESWKTSGEYSNSLLSAEDKGRAESKTEGRSITEKDHFQNQCSKPVTSRDKEVNMAARDYADALLERFKLRSGKARLADDKTLDIAGVGDWTLKDVRDQQWKVTKGSLVVARGNKRGSLYMVEVPSDGINASIDDLQKTVVGFCEPCVLGKQKKVSFVKSRNTKKLQRLELVHTDVYGPTSVASIGGSRYYVTFIDDSSRKNGVAERMNRTLNGRAKSMRLHAGLPKMFWEDSVTTAAYLINRGPSVPLGFRIPKEEWQGKEVSLAHLRVFGCDSYVKVKDVARDKLDAKSVKCTFIGYGSDEMGYRFWDSKSHKVVRSRDVTFNEDSLYGAKAATDSSNLIKPNQKDQVVLEDSLENLANKSIVTEHGLSSEITQSPGGSSDTSGGSENSGSFEDSGRSDEKDSEDRASSEEGGSETPQLRRSTREPRAPKKAINEEIVSLEKNQTWSIVRLPAGKKTLQSKWVFRVKEEQDGKKMYKARLVVKGFQQKQGAAENLHLEQLDVKPAFLHGNLDEDIYMTQPEGFQSAGKEENLVCKLKKSLYGLKQAPRQWYLKFDNFMQRAWYKRCAMDHCPAKQILGMSIIRDKTKGTLRLSHEKYIGKVLEKFNMKDAKARCQPLRDHFKLSKIQAPKTEASRRRMAKVPYASAVGSVMYSMVCTRPDIAHVVGVVSRFMSNPGREHWEAVKWLLRYLKGTSKATLCFSRKKVVLEGFSDSDYGGCLDSGKSTTGYVFTVGGTTVSWMSRIQKCVAMSTTEAEYMVIAEAGKYAIHLAKNRVFHGTLSLKKILGAKNPADMLTKVVMTEKLKLAQLQLAFEITDERRIANISLPRLGHKPGYNITEYDLSNVDLSPCEET
ncbi:retrovirus-related pol polyprotein from transposon TNT 1-94 [Tanacetum coccineum]